MLNRRFITFEGVEGSGKTTQINLLKPYFKKKRLRVVFTREPGGTPMAERIRELLVRKLPENKKDPLLPMTELLLMEAARAQHVATKIVPFLKAGYFVLCDRYADASSAYQGFGRRLGLGLVTQLNRIATHNLSPALTFLFDIDCRQGLRRSLGRRNSEKRFESERLRFHETVRRGYRVLARREPNRFVIVDGSRSPEVIFESIKSELESRYAL